MHRGGGTYAGLHLLPGAKRGEASHPGLFTGSVKSSQRQRGPTGPQLLSVQCTSLLIGAGWRWGWAGLVARLRNEGLKQRTREVKEGRGRGVICRVSAMRRTEKWGRYSSAITQVMDWSHTAALVLTMWPGVGVHTENVSCVADWCTSWKMHVISWSRMSMAKTSST